jgi:Xaa-Pro aminopeptidase
MNLMNRFYFHIRRGQVTVRDRDGVELVSDREAVDRARQIRASEEVKGADKGMIIVDRKFHTMLQVPFCGRAHEIRQP